MPEGWVVEDAKTFRLLAEHPPPRPYGYLAQLNEDARSWKPVTFWIVGTSLIGVAAATGAWLLLPVGVGVLACWFGFFWSTVRFLRHAPVLIGRIEALQRHPLLADYATAQARLEDGQEIPIFFLSRLAADILAEQGRADVLILDNPRSEYSFGFAARPVPKE
jgi:hypothetical protein